MKLNLLSADYSICSSPLASSRRSLAANQTRRVAMSRQARQTDARSRIYYSCLTAGDSIVKPDTQPHLTAHQLAQQRRSWAEQRTAAPAARQEK